MPLLVKAAQAVGVIGSPEEIALTFEFVNDGDEGVYRWLLDIAVSSPLKVSALSEAMAVLGEPDLHRAGIEVAVDILREAVQEANHLVHQLSDYIEAQHRAGRQLTCSYGLRKRPGYGRLPGEPGGRDSEDRFDSSPSYSERTG